METTNPKNKLMEEEIFGPVLTCYVYPDKDTDKILEMVSTGISKYRSRNLSSPDYRACVMFSIEMEDFVLPAHPLSISGNFCAWIGFWKLQDYYNP